MNVFACMYAVCWRTAFVLFICTCKANSTRRLFFFSNLVSFLSLSSPSLSFSLYILPLNCSIYSMKKENCIDLERWHCIAIRKCIKHKTFELQRNEERNIYPEFLLSHKINTPCICVCVCVCGIERENTWKVRW